VSALLLSCVLNYFAVQILSQNINMLAQLFYEFGQLSILLKQLHDLISLL